MFRNSLFALGLATLLSACAFDGGDVPEIGSDDYAASDPACRSANLMWIAVDKFYGEQDNASYSAYGMCESYCMFDLGEPPEPLQYCSPELAQSGENLIVTVVRDSDDDEGNPIKVPTNSCKGSKKECVAHLPDENVGAWWWLCNCRAKPTQKPPEMYFPGAKPDPKSSDDEGDEPSGEPEGSDDSEEPQKPEQTDGEDDPPFDKPLIESK